MQTKQEEEIYELTPYGLLVLHHGEKAARQICDQIELYLRRSGQAMVIDEIYGLKFVKLQKSQD